MAETGYENRQVLILYCKANGLHRDIRLGLRGSLMLPDCQLIFLLGCTHWPGTATQLLFFPSGASTKCPCSSGGGPPLGVLPLQLSLILQHQHVMEDSSGLLAAKEGKKRCFGISLWSLNLAKFRQVVWAGRTCLWVPTQVVAAFCCMEELLEAPLSF